MPSNQSRKALSRRRFLAQSMGVAAGVAATSAMASTAYAYSRILGANDRLDIGAIGVGGRGAGDLDAVSSENIVAVCDVDTNTVGAAGNRFTGAKQFFDYRELLEQTKLDAVVIGTPDHHHAPATVRALRRGLHVYCEKPLTHTVEEARIVAALAKEKGLATQMGTQNHEHPGYLRLIELLQKNVIGSVHTVHVITDRPGKWWPQGVALPTDKPAIPGNLKWDLWLGPAPERNYHSAFAPFRWRGWWDYGCGAVGDMAIHLMDPAFWGLKLGGQVTVSSEGPAPDAYCGPKWMHTKFQFGQRGELPPVEVHWYEGETTPPSDIAALLPMNGSLFVGERGMIAIAHDGFPKLLPADKFDGFKVPEPYLPASPGHHRQWIDAAKGNGKASSSFDYAGPFTEVVLLGNIAYRTGLTIVYDPDKGRVREAKPTQATPPAIANRAVDAANELLAKEYRKGWEVQ
ncbi:MAG: Inositol 2-dehydrogenase [Planctomycetota bacterium]